MTPPQKHSLWWALQVQYNTKMLQFIIIIFILLLRYVLHYTTNICRIDKYNRKKIQLQVFIYNII